MCRSLTFDLTLTFKDKIVDDNDVKIIMKNVLTSLQREAREYGITPEESDTYLTSMGIAHPLSDQTIIFKEV